MAHLMEQVLHHARGEQRGGVLSGVGKAQHQHHHRELVLVRLLAPAAAADGEVTVLWGGRGGRRRWWELDCRWPGKLILMEETDDLIPGFILKCHLLFFSGEY